MCEKISVHHIKFGANPCQKHHERVGEILNFREGSP
jgi:hypothetical protein